jgi:carbon monoxide dehydrogenase subunit G
LIVPEGYRDGMVLTSIEIPAARAVVWDELADLSSHVEWMADAHSIEFLGPDRSGVGTRMEVETRFGPLRTRDLMEVTVWAPPERMAVVHRGLFTGTGEFTLDEAGPDATRVTWREDIRFPWWFGGRIGAWFAAPVFRWVWRRNLRRLRVRVTGV